MYLAVTGAAGLIGSNLLCALNARGLTDILAIDHLKNPDKFHNLLDSSFSHYLDKHDFLAQLQAGRWDGQISAVLHQGACSDTMAQDGQYMMSNNYQYSCDLLDFCQRERIPLIYASSAAVYGASPIFREERSCEAPLNLYGYSKFLFDHVVRRRLAQGVTAQVVGLRYFNVYGPRESHKGRMASVVWHHVQQYRQMGRVQLFEGSGGYAAGAQQRDFIAVDDVAAVNLYFLDHPDRSGVFNLGTGQARSFNDLALATVNACLRREDQPTRTLGELVAGGVIEYIPFPTALHGKYQSYTQADIGLLRAAAYNRRFLTLEEGVTRYVDWLWPRR